MKKWYQQSHFRNLVDMHIPSGNGNLENFDAEKYADCMLQAGVETAYVYASNCLGLCLFPSEVGYRHSITEKRDIFGETVAALRKRGIGVVGYLNSWCSEGARMHPQWQIVTQEGHTNGETSRFGTCCLNSPYRDLFHALVYEMVSKYDIDGLWVDMIGFFASDCACPWCREKYKKETGFELPTTIDWEDENFLRYLQFKFDTVTEYARGIEEAAHRAKPDISVSLQCASWKNPHINGMADAYYDLMDYASGDFYADRNSTDVVCRILPNLTKYAPFEYMISRAPNLSYHTAIKDRSEILLQAYTAFLCGGSFLFIDAIDPDGGLNGDFYRFMGQIKKELEPFFPTIDYEAQVLRDVAVYAPLDAYSTPNLQGKALPRLADELPMAGRLQSINKALSRAHIDYDILTEKKIDEIGKYKVLILPDLHRMKQSECEKIAAYVQAGGRVYVSGSTSALSSDGKNSGSFMLSQVLGVEYTRIEDRKPVYLAPTQAGQPYFVRFSPTYPAMLPDAVPVVKPVSEQLEVLATLTYPFTDARNYLRYSSAISNPPSEKTDLPAVVRHKYGKGTCIYSVAPLELSSEVCNYDIFAELIKSLADECGGLNFTCEESEYLEHVVRHNPEKRHYTVSVLNYQNVRKIVPLRDVTFTVQLDVAPKSVKTTLGTPVQWEKQADGLHICLEKLEIYDVIYIEY